MYNLHTTGELEDILFRINRKLPSQFQINIECEDGYDLEENIKDFLRHQELQEQRIFDEIERHERELIRELIFQEEREMMRRQLLTELQYALEVGKNSI